MVPNVTDWTVVAVGQWNPAIFSPEWVGRNLLHTQAIETQLAFGPQATGIRFQSQTLIVIPQQDKLIIGVRNIEEATLREMEGAARTALQLLSHTPVRGLGINFGFTEPEPQAGMLQTFNLNDAGALADGNYTVQATHIIREIDIPRGALKLKMSHSAGIISFHFNYSHPMANAADAEGYLENQVLHYRDLTMHMLATVFHIEPQEVH